jgi:hypothetical protein
MSPSAHRRATSLARHARRIEHLQETLATCRPLTTASTSDALETALLDRIDAADLPEDPLDRLTRALLEASMTVDVNEVAAAFATAIIGQARRDVAAEARRAGHAEAFELLEVWIGAAPGSAALADLGLRLEASPRGLQTALSRLQHRFRQRVDAGLALWADTVLDRRALRKRLHAALVALEPQP